MHDSKSDSSAANLANALSPTMAALGVPRPEWLALHQEDILEPGLPIVDAHHHLWALPAASYLGADLLQDLGTGHDVRATVFIDCEAGYRTDGPQALQPVGETSFIVEQARLMEASGARYQPCAAIVSWADLSLGEQVAPVLEAHIEAGQGRFRGVRARPTWHADPGAHPTGAHREGVLLEPAVQQGVRRLGAMGLSLDVWVYHSQLGDVAALAANCPDTVMVLNHCGGPLGVGPYAGRRAEVFDEWRMHVRSLAKFPNLRMKLGGLGMPRMGFGFEQAERPVASELLAQAWGPYFETCIESFGADRCMFESNFPVDKVTCSYAVLWNAFKRASQGCSAAERADLFSGTAARTYRLSVPGVTS